MGEVKNDFIIVGLNYFNYYLYQETSSVLHEIYKEIYLMV